MSEHGPSRNSSHRTADVPTVNTMEFAGGVKYKHGTGYLLEKTTPAHPRPTHDGTVGAENPPPS